MASKQQVQKEKQGYRSTGKTCDTCYKFSNIENKKRCSIGGFAVKSRAVCDLWEEKDKKH